MKHYSSLCSPKHEVISSAMPSANALRLQRIQLLWAIDLMRVGAIAHY
jgi:hypothetical protein